MTESPFGADSGAAAASTSTTASSDPWSKPSEVDSGMDGDTFNAKSLVGALLLIKPTGYKTGVKTKFKDDADMVECDVTVIGAQQDEAGAWARCEPAQSTTLHGVALFQGRLIGKTKGEVGKGMVLGRLVQEPTDKGNPAYDLADPSEDEQKAARAWYESAMSPPF